MISTPELETLANSIFNHMRNQFPEKSFKDEGILELIDMFCAFYASTNRLNESTSSILKERIKSFYKNKEFNMFCQLKIKFL